MPFEAAAQMEQDLAGCHRSLQNQPAGVESKSGDAFAQQKIGSVIANLHL
jgi:hypothetical protein